MNCLLIQPGPVSTAPGFVLSEEHDVKLTTCVECGRVSGTSRCDEHTLGTTTTERGYGWEHQKALEDPAFLATTHCDHCDEPFTEDNPRQGGHVVAHRHGGAAGLVVAHCRHCNTGWRRTGL